MEPISDLAGSLGIPSDAWEPFGHWAAKIDPARLGSTGRRGRGRIVLVTGMTPTPGGGIGKTVTAIALASALHRRGVRAIACLRQPSLGRVFGVKDGWAGGGRSTVEPRAEVRLGLTGDFDAITSAHNLLAAILENDLHFENGRSLDPARVGWPRALDLPDRGLREIEVGLGTGNGPARRTSFVQTPASEVTAILGLARGPAELRERLGRIEVGRSRNGRFVTAADVGADGAMAALLRRALRPNLLQSAEGAPVLVHGGPVGNLSYGTTTVRALRVAQEIADLVFVEAAHATELGAEKFIDLFAPLADLEPSAAVIVASLEALRAQGPEREGLGALGPGLENLDQHIQNVRALGLAPVVALNRFAYDGPEEVEEVRAFCDARSVPMELSSAYTDGGAGAVALAELVVDAAHRGQTARPLYGPGRDLRSKVELLARRLYGADGADLSPLAEAQIAGDELAGADRLPVCLAKTPLSLSDDPARHGRARDYRVTVRRFVRAAGAGYVVAVLGEVESMPELPREPRAYRIGIDAQGEPVGVL